ncbi:MAG: HAD family hydrolase [Bacteroidetes bacterium]|nr:HAD family hydrolase [Bacteroidota bacterium]
MAAPKSDILLILDLDETLIYATKSKLAINELAYVDPYYVYGRPGLQDFLQGINEHFDIAIWSSADDAYVQEIVKEIIPDTISLKFVWGRSRCSMKRNELDEYYFEKRLDKVKKQGYRMEHILIVDDTREKSRSNYGNAIHIAEYTGQAEDLELSLLMKYLISLKDTENVRTMEKRGWRNNL